MIEEITPGEFLKTNRERYFRTGRKSLTEDQVKTLLSKITDIRDLALFEIAITTGIRRGDIVKIRTEDFNPETGALSFYEAKKGRIHRVFLPEKVMNTVKMVINVNSRGNYIFEAHDPDKPISSKTAYNLFQRYLERAGLDKRPFHSLRATCIKLCQKRGWKPEETAELVGDSLKVIQEHYTIPSMDEMKAVTKDKAIL
jgi:integrase